MLIGVQVTRRARRALVATVLLWLLVLDAALTRTWIGWLPLSGLIVGLIVGLAGLAQLAGREAHARHADRRRPDHRGRRPRGLAPRRLRPLSVPVPTAFVRARVPARAQARAA